MFKRFLAICLCAVAFVFSIIPASAVDTNAYWIDALSFGGANGRNQSSWWVPAGSSISFYLPIPSNTTVRVLDFVFRTGSSNFSFDISLGNGTSNNGILISDVLPDVTYTATCSFSFPYSTNRIDITFHNNSSSAQSFNLLNARVCTSTQPYKLSDIGISVRDWAGGLYSGEYNGNPVTVNLGPATGGPGDRGFDAQLLVQFDSWMNYEKISFNLIVSCGNLLSFNASLNQTLPLPVEVSPFDNPSAYEGNFFVTVTVDLTEVVKVNFKNEVMKIYFSGVYNNSDTNWISVQSVYGFLASGESDNRFFAYWFGVIRDGIGGIFSGLGNWFSQLFGKLSDGFQSVVDAIVGDSQENEEMENEAADQEQALGDLNSSLNDYEKPDPGSMNIDIQVDPVGLGFISGGLGGIYQSSIFGQILTMIGILGLAGYVFFGKR